MWIAFFGLCAVLAYLILTVGGPKPLTPQQRLDRLVRQRRALDGFATRSLILSPEEEAKAAAREAKRSPREALVALVERATTGRTYSTKLQLRLARADWRWRPAEFIMAQLVAAGIAGLLGLMIAQPVWWLLAAIGALIPMVMLSRSEKARAKAFGSQLPDALTMIANALRSGYSFLQAMDVVSREMPDPAAKEFGLVLREARVNIPLEEALANLVARVKSPDLDLVVTAVLIQRQVGGNLSEVLEKISETIRERIRIQGEIRTLTTQGRISGWVVSLLPVGLAIVISLISPGYMTPLFKNPIGWVLLGMSCVMLLTGIAIIRSMINVEV